MTSDPNPPGPADAEPDLPADEASRTLAVPEAPAAEASHAGRVHVPGRTRAGGVWVAAVGFAVVLVLLLVFILQNGQHVPVRFLGWHANLPVGVAMVFAAVAGLLLVAVPGTVRILQLRRGARRAVRGAGGGSSRQRRR
ncbi:MAG: LapA family protein [Actinomycetes bacterium]